MQEKGRLAGPARAVLRRAAGHLVLPEGRLDDAEALREELVDGGRCTPVWLAMVCGELGQKDLAFQYLELAIAQHDDQVSFMAVDHRFDSLRDDPRFYAALRRLGLPVLTGSSG